MDFRIENEYSEIWIGDGIIYCTGKNGIVINLNAAEKMISDREKLAEGKKYPLVVDIRTLAYMDREAREYFAGPDSTKSIKACAIIISSPTSKILGEFFVKFYQPLVPTQSFKNLESAKEWLQTYTKESEQV